MISAYLLEAIGLTISEQRKIQRLSTEQVAKRAKVSEALLKDVEAGAIDSDIASLLSICEALDFPISLMIEQAQCRSALMAS